MRRLWKRLERLTASRPGGAFFLHVATRIDRVLMREADDPAAVRGVRRGAGRSGRYEQRAAERQIPVVLLTPADDPQGGG